LEYLKRDNKFYEEVYLKIYENFERIEKEIRKFEGISLDLGGYYLPEDDKLEFFMFPSKTLKKILNFN